MSELNGKYVNEENYQKNKKRIKKLGVVLLVLGAILSIIGAGLLIAGISKSFNMSANFNGDTHGFGSSTGLIIGGFLLIACGSSLLIYGVYATFFAHARDISSYVASSTLPVASDVVNYVATDIAPPINKGIGNLAESISSGISRGINKGKTSNARICPNCQTQNEVEDKFCKNCGADLLTKKVCASCGKELDKDEKFCGNCGTKVN